MLKTTLKQLQCPKRKKGKAICGGELKAVPQKMLGSLEIWSGHLSCVNCQAQFPIVAGVAVLMNSVADYFEQHAKGISKLVTDNEIPKELRKRYLAAKRNIHVEAIEWDLESERVLALYFMTHFLTAGSSQKSQPWWRPPNQEGSPLIEELIQKYWDRGPLAQVKNWVEKISAEKNSTQIIELGCGVGGLPAMLQNQVFQNQAAPSLSRYLGVDSSFASIALARHLRLGTPYPSAIKIPQDLLAGQFTKEIFIPAPFQSKQKDNIDFVVGDLDANPAMPNQWDIAIALNTIDMLEDPESLPRLQYSLLKKSGIAIQSCPYVWPEKIAEKIRAKTNLFDSAKAVEKLYEGAQLKMIETKDHLPWLFFKHARQLEIYSVHLLMAKKV